MQRGAGAMAMRRGAGRFGAGNAFGVPAAQVRIFDWRRPAGLRHLAGVQKPAALLRQGAGEPGASGGRAFPGFLVGKTPFLTAVSRFFSLFCRECPSLADCFLTLFPKSNKIKKALCIQRAEATGVPVGPPAPQGCPAGRLGTRKKSGGVRRASAAFV